MGERGRRRRLKRARAGGGENNKNTYVLRTTDCVLKKTNNPSSPPPSNRRWPAGIMPLRYEKKVVATDGGSSSSSPIMAAPRPRDSARPVAAAAVSSGRAMCLRALLQAGLRMGMGHYSASSLVSVVRRAAAAPFAVFRHAAALAGPPRTALLLGMSAADIPGPASFMPKYYNARAPGLLSVVPPPFQLPIDRPFIEPCIDQALSINAQSHMSLSDEDIAHYKLRSAMASMLDTSTCVSEPRSGMELDLICVHKYFRRNVPGYPERATAARLRQFGHGQSNPTFLVEAIELDGQSLARYVLRKKPPVRIFIFVILRLLYY